MQMSLNKENGPNAAPKPSRKQQLEMWRQKNGKIGKIELTPTPVSRPIRSQILTADPKPTLVTPRTQKRISFATPSVDPETRAAQLAEWKARKQAENPAKTKSQMTRDELIRRWREEYGGETPKPKPRKTEAPVDPAQDVDIAALNRKMEEILALTDKAEDIRGAFDELANDPECPGIVCCVQYWAMRARFEESRGNYDEVVRLYEEAAQHCKREGVEKMLNGFYARLKAKPKVKFVPRSDGFYILQVVEEPSTQEFKRYTIAEAVLKIATSLATIKVPKRKEKPQTAQVNEQPVQQEAVQDRASLKKSGTVARPVVASPRMFAKPTRVFVPEPEPEPQERADGSIAISEAPSEFVGALKEVLPAKRAPAINPVGSMVVLESVRLNRSLQNQLGVETALTPVRKSKRLNKNMPFEPVTDANVKQALDETNFAYVDNSEIRRNWPSSPVMLLRARAEVDEFADIEADRELPLPNKQTSHAPNTPHAMPAPAAIPATPSTPHEFGRFSTLVPVRVSDKRKTVPTPSAATPSAVVVTPARRSRRLNKEAPWTPSERTKLVIFDNENVALSPVPPKEN